MSDVQITQEATFLMELANQVASGRSVPAAFQRPYVWTEDDIIALWTSIIKGYPLGAFLLWEPSGESAEAYARSSLGPIAFTPQRRSSLILDGQNRLITLAWSMTPYGEPTPADAAGADIWRAGKVLVADPHLQQARFVDQADAGKNLLMPISCLFERRLQPYLRENWDGDEADVSKVEWLDGLIYKVNGARIVVTTIKHATPSEAVEAFVHIARVGVPVSDRDIAAALTKAVA